VLCETEKTLTPTAARDLLSQSPSIEILDDPDENLYPLPVHVASTDKVYVGRLRKDLSSPNGLWLWIVADNLRKGAALNAVQIAERLIEMDLL
jgi:aspartate-semialdehyde dehydrogenase